MFPLLFLLLTAGTDNSYQKAESQVSLVISAHHDDIDSISLCGGKIRSVLLRDTVLNKPGAIGTEYNYPLYKHETEIMYYEDGKIALLENRTVYLKRYSANNVTTGIQITKTLDSTTTFYFDEQQQPVNEKEFLKIEKRICKD